MINSTTGINKTVTNLSPQIIERIRVAQWVSWITNNSYKPITNTAWVRALLCKLQKGCNRIAAAIDKAYQLLGHGRWFSPGTPASSTTKTGRHDIAEILLKVALKHQQQQKNKQTDHWTEKDKDILYADGHPVPGLLLEMYYFIIIKQYILWYYCSTYR